MNTFHGYPIPDDRHPEHVNWTMKMAMGVFGMGIPSGFVRRDGIRPGARTDDDMARIDRESPMPRPPVLVGQVWRLPSGTFATVVGFVNGVIQLLMFTSSDDGTTLPPGSDLVWGPFAPWEDTGVKP